MQGIAALVQAGVGLAEAKVSWQEDEPSDSE